ncbi:hypothetical protein [Geothrix terrae]|uniref:hypothetical protein n=1 Tax=Geothrix terrae TaxID=2922720 RepID=UPI001FACC736|nr:hypothetical protein [Geothrix terrae]
MDDISNPYAPPEALLAEPGAEVASERRPIYTPFQVRLASFLGGPFAAVFTLHQNFKALQDTRGQRLTLGLGIAFNVALLALLPFLPERFPRQVIPLLYSIAAGGVASAKQLSKAQLEASEQYQRRSGWNVTGVVLVSFLAFCLVVFPPYLLLNHWGVLRLD